MKDILLYISDQHSWHQQGYAGDPIVRTPNLDRIAKSGTAFQNCYTAYPLCVPARMSMMTGQYASTCGVMHNFAALDSNQATFAHCLRNVGYDTVLCGRMHFVGGDQRHGFSQRLVGDITPIYQNRPMGAFAEERGVHLNTPTGTPASLSIIGGGNSPTLEFDRAVVKGALEYLEEDHDAPQFLCVGTYGPHHPYVAPEELYTYYYDKVSVPEHTFDLPEHPAVAGTILTDKDPETVRAVRAAYYGMVEFEDQQIGKVYDAFQAYLARTGHEGIFVYVSDHGEQEGYRGYYGKSTFYDPSSHIPMIVSGSGIQENCLQYGACSLADLGPTLCELAGAPAIPDADGTSLAGRLQTGQDDPERVVLSEVGGSHNMKDGKFTYGQMAKWKNYKLIHFDGFDGEDQLFDLESDPDEMVNRIGDEPEVAQHMREAFANFKTSPDTIRQQSERLIRNLKILSKSGLDSDERWRNPPCARDYPPIMTKSKIYP